MPIGQRCCSLKSSWRASSCCWRYTNTFRVWSWVHRPSTGLPDRHSGQVQQPAAKSSSDSDEELPLSKAVRSHKKHNMELVTAGFSEEQEQEQADWLQASKQEYLINKNHTNYIKKGWKIHYGNSKPENGQDQSLAEKWYATMKSRYGKLQETPSGSGNILNWLAFPHHLGVRRIVQEILISCLQRTPWAQSCWRSQNQTSFHIHWCPVSISWKRCVEMFAKLVNSFVDRCLCQVMLDHLQWTCCNEMFLDFGWSMQNAPGIALHITMIRWVLGWGPANLVATHQYYRYNVKCKNLLDDCAQYDTTLSISR